MAQLNSDDRLVKSAGNNVRSDRDTADTNRINKDGTALTAQERRDMLRRDWVQEILPTPPDIPGFHVCWLSTTNSMDPIYKRIQRGYMPVTNAEFPALGGSSIVKDGEFKGCIACNEMLLFKIEEQLYQDLMAIYHYDMPQEQERGIFEKVNAGTGSMDSNGRNLDLVEGDFGNLGRGAPQAPHFN